MNDLTKKILIIASLLLSIAACVGTLFHARRSDIVYQSVAATRKAAASGEPEIAAPVRVISPTGSTWLDVQKKVKDTVVQIFAHVADFNWLEPYKTPDQGEGVGSGFFVDHNGNIISNYHVVAQASSIEIQIPSFGLERFDVDIVGVAPERDIALLRLTKESKEKIEKKIKRIPYLKLGNSDNVLRSQEVLALGYPLGQTRLKSTLGIVSGREKLGSSGFIQITAPLNQGNSGGPALDTNGHVVGINARGILEAQNVGYIIPINEVKSALEDLHKVKLLRKPVLGCIFAPATPEMAKFLGNPPPGGWYITKIFKDTLMEKAGLKEGDMLYGINGYDVDMYGEIDVPWSEDKASLLEYLNRLTVGDTIELSIYRKGTHKVFSFKFEHKNLPSVRMIYPEFESESTAYEMIGGMVVMQLTLNHVGMLIPRAPDLVRYGKIEAQYDPALIITHVLPNSQAFKTRIFLRPGHILEEVNGESVKTLDEFRRAIVKSKQTGYVTLRTDNNLYAVMSVDKILKDEDMLAARYFFPKSPLIGMLADSSKSPAPVKP